MAIDCQWHTGIRLPFAPRCIRLFQIEYVCCDIIKEIFIVIVCFQMKSLPHLLLLSTFFSLTHSIRFPSDSGRTDHREAERGKRKREKVIAFACALPLSPSLTHINRYTHMHNSIHSLVLQNFYCPMVSSFTRVLVWYNCALRLNFLCHFNLWFDKLKFLYDFYLTYFLPFYFLTFNSSLSSCF